MTTHEAFLELAAATIDFDLDADVREELDLHLAECEACRRTATAYRDDAVAITSGVEPRLSPARSVAILAGALEPPRRSNRRRLIGVGAFLPVLGVGLIAAAIGLGSLSQVPPSTVVPSPSTSPVPRSSIGAPGLPSAAVGPTEPPALATPRPDGSAAGEPLLVRGPGQQLGTQIRMAPGFDRDLYVSIPVSGGSILARLDGTGRSMSGWPVRLPGAGECGSLLPVADGSIRVACQFPTDQVAEGPPPSRAYAFGPDGAQMPGWPVALPCCLTGRVIGDVLTVYAEEVLGSEFRPGDPIPRTAAVITVASDGTIRNGEQVTFQECCISTWAIGPDGVAYGTLVQPGDTPADATSQVTAVGLPGFARGFPIAIDGIASTPSFDAAGRIHLTVGSPFERPARTLVFDPDGSAVAAGSGPLDLAVPSEWDGIEGSGGGPIAPLVGPDGTTYLIDIFGNRTIVAGLSPTGRAMRGWPYRSDARHQSIGFCAADEVCEGSYWALPAIGPGDVLYLVHAAANSAAGGSIVAINRDGRVVPGWPVGLRRAGSAFWSVVVASDGTAYALAIEPEPNGSHSVTILSLAADSSVLYRATIVEP